MIPTSPSPANALPRCLLVLLFLLVHPSLAQPATLVFNDCYSGNASRKMSVDTVYSQIIGDQLNFTVLGDSATEIINSNTTTVGMFARHLLV